MKVVAIAALLAAVTLLPVAAQAQDVSVSVSASASVSASIPDPSSALSSASSDMSSAMSSASSELSSSLSSTSESSAMAGMDCSTLDPSAIALANIDAAALAAVTSVTVFSVSACSTLGDLANLDAGALAGLSANQQVVAALQSSGQAGAEIVGYHLEGTSLTVYVRDRM